MSAKKSKEKKVLKVPESLVFFEDQFGDTFARVRNNWHYEVHPIRSAVFKRFLVSWLLESNIKPTLNNINEYLMMCEANAMQKRLKYTLYNRLAPNNGSIYLDLTDEQWQVAEVNEKGVQILDKQETPMFRRYSHMKAMPVDLKGTAKDFDAFMALLNVKNESDRLLVQVYIPTCLIPGIPHVILIPVGGQGSAKSTFNRLIRELLDNSVIPLLSMPRNNTELVQQLQHHYMPYYDNVHELQQWQSDALCRASTGEGFTKRALYTDDDDRVYNYRRCVGVNGINTPGTQPDFLDRSMLTKLERIPKEQRKEETVMEALFERIAPKVRGYLLNVVSKALKNLEIVRAELKGKLPRMADFAVYGEAISRAMGNEPMAFFDAYMENIAAANKEALANSLVASLLLEYLKTEKDWIEKEQVEIDATVCYQGLRTLALEKGYDLKANHFPGSASILTRRLNTMKATLAEEGYAFSSGHTDTGSAYTVGYMQSAVSAVMPSAIDDKKPDGTADGTDKGAQVASAKLTALEKDNNAVRHAVSENDVVTDATDATDGILHTSIHGICYFCHAEHKPKKEVPLYDLFGKLVCIDHLNAAQEDDPRE